LREVWNEAYSNDGSFFGEEPSTFALLSCQYFKERGMNKVLELGCGQGRDALFFASQGIAVKALDYSSVAIDVARTKAKERALPVDATVHDVRRPLPFGNDEFDAVYSHMFFSMLFTWSELKFIFQELRRVLKGKGLNFFSVRNNNDRFYREGKAADDGIYDVNGFQIRFFDRHDVESMMEGFQILEIKEAHEDPATLYLVLSSKSQFQAR